jgi:hypothetical protein
MRTNGRAVTDDVFRCTIDDAVRVFALTQDFDGFRFGETEIKRELS